MCYNLEGPDRLNVRNLQLFCSWQQPEVEGGTLQIYPDRREGFEKNEGEFERRTHPRLCIDCVTRLNEHTMLQIKHMDLTTVIQSFTCKDRLVIHLWCGDGYFGEHPTPDASLKLWSACFPLLCILLYKIYNIFDGKDKKVLVFLVYIYCAACG